MKVIICGAGLAGLTMALCLERRGHSARIVESAPHPRNEGYLIDVFGSGYDALERLGLLPDLDGIHEAVENLIVLDRNGHERLSVPYTQLRKRLFRNRHFNVTRGSLERLLSRRLAASTIQFGTTVDSFYDNGARVWVELSDGAIHGVDLLIALTASTRAFDASRLATSRSFALSATMQPHSPSIRRPLSSH